MTDIGPGHMDAVFSPDGRHRLRLDRHLGNGLVALVCMANPSVAGADMNDITVARLNRLLPLRGIGRYTVVNDETYIATDVRDMRRWRDEIRAADYPAYRALRASNLALIRRLSAQADIRIAAWGRLIEPSADLLAALSLDAAHPIFALGTVKDGAPKHPAARAALRVRDDDPMMVWRPADPRAAAIAELSLQHRIVLANTAAEPTSIATIKDNCHLPEATVATILWDLAKLGLTESQGSYCWYRTADGTAVVAHA